MNQNALIVGASGGIGLSLVREMLQNDRIARVYATYRRSNPELLALERRYRDRLHCLYLDLREEEQIAAAIARIQTQSDKLHWVVNCVGMLHQGDLQPEKSLRQLETEPLLQYFQVNSIGAILLIKHLLPLLRHRERSILATISAKIGSIGDNYIGGWYGYRASKAALNMFLRTAAIEYRRKSPETIIVALHPGTTDTALSKPFQKNVPPEKLFSPQRTVKQLLEVMSKLTPEDSGQFFSWDGTRLPW